MGPPLPEKLRVTTAVLGVLSIITTALRCYVRTRIVKNWGYDDTFIVIAFIFHMWYEGTLLTGIHYGTGQRTADVSPTDAVHAMRCWWLCFLAYATTITLAKISAGFFFLRITGTLAFHRITTIFVTVLAALVGFAFLFLSVFQCSPVQYFWTRLEGKSGTCIDMDIMIAMTYFYGSVSAFTDIAFGVLVAVMLWNLKVDKKTKILIAPFLAMACIASYAAFVRMPYAKNFKNPDFLYATVEISLWSTVEVGVSVFAANLATLRPLAQKIVEVSRNTSSIFRRTTTHPVEKVGDAVIDNQLKKSGIALVEVKDCDSPISDRLDTGEKTKRDDGSTASLTRSTRCPV